MIFKKFTLFRSDDEPTEHLQGDYNDLINELNTGLSRFRITENFENQLFTELAVANGTTKTLRHNLGRVPLGRIILKQTGDAVLEDGAYTENTVELINNSANDVVVTIIYLK
jgi:hypothetical protein